MQLLTKSINAKNMQPSIVPGVIGTCNRICGVQHIAKNRLHEGKEQGTTKQKMTKINEMGTDLRRSASRSTLLVFVMQHAKQGNRRLLMFQFQYIFPRCSWQRENDEGGIAKI